MDCLLYKTNWSKMLTSTEKRAKRNKRAKKWVRTRKNVKKQPEQRQNDNSRAVIVRGLILVYKNSHISQLFLDEKTRNHPAFSVDLFSVLFSSLLFVATISITSSDFIIIVELLDFVNKTVYFLQNLLRGMNKQSAFITVLKTDCDLAQWYCNKQKVRSQNERWFFGSCCVHPTSHWLGHSLLWSLFSNSRWHNPSIVYALQ